MKKQSFTLIELLTVIAIMAILAGILMPVLGSARARARAASCSSNQSQVSKLLSIELDKTDNKLHAGTTVPSSFSTTATPTASSIWSVYLYEKNIIQDFKALRCSEIPLEADDAATLTPAEAKRVFGIVSTTANNGILNFKGTKLLHAGTTTISPSALIIGGCSINKPNTTSEAGHQYAVLTFSGDRNAETSYTGAIHGGSSANFFFYDGHVESLDGETIVGKYAVSEAEGSAGEAAAEITSSSKWLTKDKVVF